MALFSVIKWPSFQLTKTSGPVDVVDWTPELVAEHVEQACRRCGKHYFIPCLTQGGNYSSFPGVYDAVSEAIGQVSARLF
jgi:hypothetical protein